MQYNNNKIVNLIFKCVIDSYKFNKINNKYYSYKFAPNHQWIKILKNKPVNNNNNNNNNNNSINSSTDENITTSNYSNNIHSKEVKCLVGITNYANIAIDKVTDVKLPNTNDLIKKDQPNISIKTLEGDINFLSPISGKVIKVNQKIKNDPSQINKPLPLSQSWIMEVAINEQNKNIIKNQLMDQLEYAHYCEDVDFKQF